MGGDLHPRLRCLRLQLVVQQPRPCARVPLCFSGWKKIQQRYPVQTCWCGGGDRFSARTQRDGLAVCSGLVGESDAMIVPYESVRARQQGA